MNRCCKDRWPLIALGLMLLPAAGCSLSQFTNPPPRVLSATPSPDEVIQAVNRNNGQIQSFSTGSATLSGPGYPPLRANIAYQRPSFFRLRATLGVFGQEVDLGSNDQLFWFWVKRSDNPGLFYCRHDQFLSSRARQTLPIDPGWLVEALGTSTFDTSLPHQGPYPAKGGRLQMRTIRETPEGPSTKITVVDAQSAWVMEQHLFDSGNRLLASSYAEGYRQDPASRLFMPSAVRIECPPAHFSLRITLGDVQINRLSGNPAELWSMPSMQGTQTVDLGGPM